MVARLRIDGVSKRFATEEGVPVQALAPTSFEVAEGEFVSIIGPSGCGKTTLFNIIGGLLESDSGRVLVDDQPIKGSHRAVGMVFQEESNFPWRTVLKNVALPLEVAGVARAERERIARHFIQLVGLEGFEQRYPAELSGGMLQRTAIARTLAYSPRIMLMDEPFGSLDEQTRLLLADKLMQICREIDQTTLLITHNITEAVQLSNRVIVMSFRPGSIKRIVPIDLPTPRTSEIISDDAFAHYVGQIWEELRSEAARGMQAADEASRQGPPDQHL
ncbi:MAG: ABC transporter ATP-binding protein [bacterium]